MIKADDNVRDNASGRKLVSVKVLGDLSVSRATLHYRSIGILFLVLIIDLQIKETQIAARGKFLLCLQDSKITPS